MKKGIIATAVIVLIGSLMAWQLFANKQEIDSRKEVKVNNESIAVTIAEVGKQSIGTNVSLTGSTEANQVVKIASKTSGEIVQINFKLGDYVSKGTVLARVDDTYTKLAVDNAKINYNKYKEDVERYQILRVGDAVTETQLRDMKIAFENARIQLEQAQRQLEDTYIRAPFSGYITSKDVDLGKFVSVSTPIAEIADISELKVVVSVSESNVYNLQKGQQVSVNTPIYPGISFPGKIVHISAKGDNSHSYPIEISLANSKEHPLKAGTYVDIAINSGESQPALCIPRDAILSSVKDPTVYRVEDGVATLVKITTGKSYDSYLEVTSGLNEGDKVITTGQINLMDGARVALVN
jgi:RND family efflux transporter MFP subunit